jgi:hypothetical protein
MRGKPVVDSRLGDDGHRFDLWDRKPGIREE